MAAKFHEECGLVEATMTIKEIDAELETLNEPPTWRHVPDRQKSPFPPPPEDDTFAHRVRRELVAIGDMLIAKNQAYGNSALDPVRIFSKADTVEQIKVRIDDKLSRLKRGLGADVSAADAEDVVMDLMGYLVLLRLATQAPRAADAALPSKP